MQIVTAEISMSLDGYVAGPADTADRPLGEAGERLHEWIYGLASWRERHGLAGGATGRESELVDEAFKSAGAVVMGRRMFNLGHRYWGETPPFRAPVYVVTHDPRQAIRARGTTFTFVSDGIESALAQARLAAGNRNVSVAGGASVIRQCLRAGLLDELELHLVHVLLGGGRRLFDRPGIGRVKLERVRVIDSPGVTHIRFRVVK